MAQTHRHAETVARARSLASSGAGRSIRIAANLSQAEFAREVGCAPGTVHKFENGQGRVPSYIAARYCRLLDRLSEVGS